MNFSGKAMKMMESQLPESGVAAAALAKFLPAGLGAAIMIAVDPPQTKRQLFAFAFVAFASTYLFGEALFDFLQSTSMFSFLSYTKRGHVVAVDGLVGALGWSLAVGVSMVARSFRKDPFVVIRKIRGLGKK